MVRTCIENYETISPFYDVDRVIWIYGWYGKSFVRRADSIIEKKFQRWEKWETENQKICLYLRYQKVLELYQSYSIKDYDYWDYKQSVMFSLFVEKFEKEGNALEYKAS